MTLGEYLPNSNTKLLLHLNGNSTDSSGKGNVGTDTSITYGMAYGKFGQGANFNGSSSKIQFPKNSNTYLYNNWTMIAWVKRNITGIDYMTIYQMGNCFFYCSGCYYYDGGGDRVITNSLFNKNDITNYHMYAWTKSSTDGQKFYQDGVLAGTESSTSNNSNNYSNVFLGYCTSPAPTQSSNQNIDEFILEGDVWSPEKIKKYYTMTKGRFGII